MARTRGKSKKSKNGHELTQRFLYYELDIEASGSNSHYLDLAAGMSALNRRLYRQGRQYHVANVSVVDTSGKLTSCRFATLPQVWTTNKAWKLMFDAWKDQRARALENSPTNVSGRWADFKVWMSEQHMVDANNPDIPHNAGVARGGILPVTSDMITVPFGEWMISDVSYVKDGTEYENRQLWMLGPHVETGAVGVQGVGLCAALEEMLAQPPESPILPTDFKNAIVLSMNPSAGADMQDDILENIRDDNDVAPYSITEVIGADHTSTDSQSFTIREVGWASGAKGIASLPTMGFPVPLGLLEVRTTTSGASTDNMCGIMIELVPGSYKGVHAEAF